MKDPSRSELGAFLLGLSLGIFVFSIFLAVTSGSDWRDRRIVELTKELEGAKVRDATNRQTISDLCDRINGTKGGRVLD